MTSLDKPERRRTDENIETVLRTRDRLLKMIDDGISIDETLKTLVFMLEQQSTGMLGSVLLVQPDRRHFRVAAAPSLPPSYNALFQSVTIGEAVGSCGTAAHRGETVIVADIASDPLWANYKELALQHGLKACWSVPIKSQAEVIGTFAMYYGETRSPDPYDLDLIEAAREVAAAVIQHSRAEQVRVGVAARKQTILIVEDEDALREVIAEFLVGFGYEVLTTGRGREAMKICSHYPGTIDLLLTDVLMPEMNGKELVNAVTRIRPDMKILYMSGNPAGVLSLSEDALIEKPFLAAELADRIRRIIEPVR